MQARSVQYCELRAKPLQFGHMPGQPTFKLSKRPFAPVASLPNHVSQAINVICSVIFRLLATTRLSARAK